jgi:Flp pilus assembly protein CpaB
VITETLPRNSVPAGPTGALLSDQTAGLSNLVFSSTVQAGQLVLRPMLVSSARSTAASVLTIPTGDVAITVQMCDQEAVAGYVTAGSEIMVYETYPNSVQVNLERGCTPQHNALPPPASTTQIVLPKVLVLAVAQAQSGVQSSSPASAVVEDPINSVAQSLSSGTVDVTVAVSPTNGIKLIHDAEVYLPYFALLPSTH